MTKTRLGRSGLEVSRLGLGMAAIGRPGYINIGHGKDLSRRTDVESMRSHAFELLDEAFNNGIRYYDAARSYGKAEEFLSGWLKARSIPAGLVTIGSKWGYTYTADWEIQAEAHEIKDHSVETFQRQLLESRHWFGDQLALYQIHSATLESGVLENVAVLERLGKLKAECVAIGLSLSGPAQAKTLERALDVTVDGERLFDTVQATWNILEPSVGQMLAEADRAGMGIIVKEAVANGRLTPGNEDPGFANQRETLDSIAEEHHSTIDALAIAAVLAQPWVDVVLCGATTIEQLYSNLRAVELRLNPEVQERLAALAETPEVYWATRSRLPWN